MIRLRQRLPDSQLIDESGVLARPGWLLAGLCLAASVKSIEPPFYLFYPPDAAPFGAGWSLANFLGSSWAILLILFVLAGGLLGDLYGRRRVLLVGVAVTLLANFCLLLTPNPLWHVFWRMVAGISAGVVMPLTLAPIFIFFVGRQRAVAFAIYILSLTVGLVLAEAQARLFSQWLGWPFVYLLPALLSLLALFTVFHSLPESRSAEPQLMDAVLYTGWTIVVLGFVYAAFELVFGQEWLLAVVVLFVLVQAIGVGMLGWWRRRTHSDPRRAAVLHLRHVLVLMLFGVVLQITVVGYTSLAYNYLRIGRGFSTVQAVLALAPILIGMLLSIWLIGRYRARVSVRRVAAAGTLLVVFSLAAAALLARLPYWLLVVPFILFGLGILSAKTIWTNAFFQVLIDRYIGLNAGINSAALLVGGALGGVVTTELLATFGEAFFVRQAAGLRLSESALEIVYQNTDATLAAGEALGLRDVAQLVSEELFGLYQQAYISGYSLTVLLIAALCLFSAWLIFRGLLASLQYQPDGGPLEQPEDAQAELPAGSSP